MWRGVLLEHHNIIIQDLVTCRYRSLRTWLQRLLRTVGEQLAHEAAILDRRVRVAVGLDLAQPYFLLSAHRVLLERLVLEMTSAAGRSQPPRAEASRRG